MVLHRSAPYTVYFGNAQDQLYKADYMSCADIEGGMDDMPPFFEVKKRLGAQELVFLDQIHSADSVLVDKNFVERYKPFRHEGDALMTQLPHIALGIMTADCLPVVCYDKRHHAIAIAHAGWKGSLQQIVPEMLNGMHNNYGTTQEDIQFFFGPSAKVCCYEVGRDVSELVCQEYEHAIHIRGGRSYFDLSRYNIWQLMRMGVPKNVIHVTYNTCTICDEQYFSHRRQGELAGRQMTVVCMV